MLSEIESSFVNFDRAIIKVLVPQKNPNLDLPSVELVAHLIEEIIQQFIQVMWLDGDQLLEQFFILGFLLAFVEISHYFELTLADFPEEYTLGVFHIENSEGFIAPAFDKPGHAFALVEQYLLARVCKQEFSHVFLRLLFDDR